MAVQQSDRLLHHDGDVVVVVLLALFVRSNLLDYPSDPLSVPHLEFRIPSIRIGLLSTNRVPMSEKMAVKTTMSLYTNKQSTILRCTLFPPHNY